MQKDKNSKKNSIERLHKILDNNSSKDLHPKDEKYLRSLNKRLERSSKENMVYRKVASKDNSKKEIDHLKPRVTIYPREEKKVPEFTEVKEEKTELEIEKPLAVSPLPAKEGRYEDEDIFEVEKVEVSEPEFIEVKPKEIAKEEILEEKKALADNELTEWEPVDIEKEEVEEKSLPLEKKEEFPEQEPVQFEEIGKEMEDKEKSKVTNNFCSKCGAKLREMASFCPECGNKIITDYEESKKDKSELIDIEEIEPVPAFIPVKKVEEKEEPAKLEEETAAVEEPSIDRDSKIEAFKDIKSIDDETAVLLYDNGFTTVDALTIASLKDLTKIKGIKRKIAKKIKKEIEQKSEWKPIDAEESDTEEIIEEKLEDGASLAIDEKEGESPEIEPIAIEETAEGKITEEQIEVKEEIIEREAKIEAFNDMESIDDETAILLYDNGFTTVDALTIASLKDLTKIKGIKRKIAKKIKKEIEQKSEWEPVDIEIGEPKEEKDEYFIDKEKSKKDKVYGIDEKILEYEPLEAEEEFFEEEDIEDVPPTKVDEEEVFKDISRIDEKIAKLLKENGINSIDALRKTTIKELIKIKGIKRKIAKQIKKEVNELTKDKVAEEIVAESFERGENPFIKEDEWESFDADKISDSKMREIKGFRHGDYTLYKKEIETKSGKKQTVRFFSKAEPEEGEPIELPNGYEVKENKKTRIPYLKKKK